MLSAAQSADGVVAQRSKQAADEAMSALFASQAEQFSAKAIVAKIKAAQADMRQLGKHATDGAKREVEERLDQLKEDLRHTLASAANHAKTADSMSGECQPKQRRQRAATELPTLDEDDESMAEEGVGCKSNGAEEAAAAAKAPETQVGAKRIFILTTIRHDGKKQGFRLSRTTPLSKLIEASCSK